MKTDKKQFCPGHRRRIPLANIPKGFSLVELLSALVILGVLIAISIPQFKKHSQAAHLTATRADLREIVKATLICASEKSFSQCDSLAEIGIKDISMIFLSSDQTVVSSHTSKSPRVCYKLARAVTGERQLGCVSINMDEGTFKQHVSVRECYATDPVTMAFVLPNPPLPCRGGSDCPPAHPLCSNLHRSTNCDANACCHGVHSKMPPLCG